MLYEVILVAPNGKITYQTDGNTAAKLLIEEGWKPYLCPMDSITAEEIIELYKAGFCDNEGTPYDIPGYIDWLNANYFHYRGLIPKGLANEALEGMYK